jgi:hypothetical protein
MDKKKEIKYDPLSDDQIVATQLRLLSWSHFIELIKIKDSVKNKE